MPHLTPTQISSYKTDGYLLHNHPVFPPQKFTALKSLFESLLHEWIDKKVSRSPEHMDVPHFWEPRLFDYLLDDSVLDLVEPLIGPDIALFSSHFICKPPAVGKRVPWHEDSSYWKGRLDPMTVVTVWLAIDPSTPDNGCMQVIPASHHNGFSSYDKVPDTATAVFGTEIRPDQFDASTAVNCILQPNQCSLHDGKLIHGSAANTGHLRRCGYTMRYMPTTVKHSNPGDFQIYLARGKDKANNHYADPTKVNRAWIDKYPEGQPAGH
jgi:hypothetical protein